MLGQKHMKLHDISFKQWKSVSQISSAQQPNGIVTFWYLKLRLNLRKRQDSTSKAQETKGLVGLSPLPVTVVNKGLVRDPLL